MTIKLQIKKGAIKKVCQLHNGIFNPTGLCHTVNFILSIPLCYLLNFGIREEKTFCTYVCFTVSRYIEEGRKSYL